MNNKRLGGNYEREIAKKLNFWLCGNDNELAIWRTAGSGNVATIRNKKNLKTSNMSGDFQILDSKYEEFGKLFYIDSKSLKNVHLMLINPNNIKSSQLLNEWVKVCNDAQKNNKIPLMFVKARNDRKIPEFVIISKYTKFRSNVYMSYFFQDFMYDCILILQKEFFAKNIWEDLVKFNKSLI